MDPVSHKVSLKMGCDMKFIKKLFLFKRIVLQLVLGVLILGPYRAGKVAEVLSKIRLFPDSRNLAIRV